MGTSKVIDKKFRNKVKTNIRGFDEMLFGGLDLVPDHSVIVIKTDEPVQGTMNISEGNIYPHQIRL